MNIPMSFNDFKSVGYYEYAIPPDLPVVNSMWQAFNADPVKNPLGTPSGIELYSQRVVDAFVPAIRTSLQFPSTCHLRRDTNSRSRRNIQ